MATVYKSITVLFLVAGTGFISTPCSEMGQIKRTAQRNSDCFVP